MQEESPAYNVIQFITLSLGPQHLQRVKVLCIFLWRDLSFQSWVLGLFHTYWMFFLLPNATWEAVVAAALGLLAFLVLQLVRCLAVFHAWHMLKMSCRPICGFYPKLLSAIATRKVNITFFPFAATFIRNRQRKLNIRLLVNSFLVEIRNGEWIVLRAASSFLSLQFCPCFQLL